MNVGDVATRVKRQFGDESAVQVTDSDIIRWINDAQREIASKNNLLQIRQSTVAQSGKSDYGLPADILVFNAVYYNKTKLKELSLQEFDAYVGRDNTRDAGTPEIYYIFADLMTLFPTPNSSSAIIGLYYCKIPGLVTLPDQFGPGYDTLELPEKYHNRIVEYCLQQAYELDEDYNASQIKNQQFNRGLNDQLESENWMTRDFYPTVFVRPEDW